MKHSSWMYEWLDGMEIRSEEDLARALAERDWFPYAEQLTSEYDAAEDRLEELDVPAVVAGRSMDLSGLFSCGTPACQIASADRLLTRALHYFDLVVVEGLGPQLFRFEARGGATAHLTKKVYDHALVLLHLRAIGADRYLRFLEKPHAFCDGHYQQHAKELGLPVVTDEGLAKSVIDRMAAEVKTEVIQLEDGRTRYGYRHPWLDLWSVMTASEGGPPSVEEWARRTYVQHCVGEIGDVGLARLARLPLMSTADRVIDLSRQSALRREDSDVDQIGLTLSIPVVAGLAPSELLQLRDEHRDEFQRFRAALVAAIRDQLKRLGNDEDPKTVARAVKRDFIEPELAAIERRMRASRRAMSTKLAQNVSVGAVAVSIGVIANLPLLLSAGVAISAAGSIAHLNKWTDNVQEVQLNDLYFLWRVARQHDH